LGRGDRLDASMWLRRLGMPPLWPSRLKVIGMGLLSSMFTATVFQYLNSADADYLNLASPVSPRIKCLYPKSQCGYADDPLECMLNKYHGRVMTEDGPPATHCPKPASLADSTCYNASLPISTLTGATSRLHTSVKGVDPLKMWSWLFLVVMVLTSVFSVVHDLALLEDGLRSQISTLMEMSEYTPKLWKFLMCVQCRKRSGSFMILRRSIRLSVWPVWFCIALVLFMGIVYPFALGVFLRHPIRMTRIMVFLSGILSGLWSIVFMLMTAIRFRGQWFNLLWSVEDCICGCKFPLTSEVVLRLLAFGVAVLAHSVSLVLRTLKGLRRTEWANMLTVLYSVPVEAFPVQWERPDEVGGGPIRWRHDGQPIQGEPAFDPFCLMDEQPESDWTRVKIEPVLRSERFRDAAETSTFADIGFCGFPCARDIISGRAMRLAFAKRSREMRSQDASIGEFTTWLLES